MDDDEFNVGMILFIGGFVGPFISYGLAWAIVNAWQITVLIGQGAFTFIGGLSLFYYMRRNKQ